MLDFIQLCHLTRVRSKLYGNTINIVFSEPILILCKLFLILAGLQHTESLIN